MAHSIKRTKLIEGTYKAIYHISFVGDGESADLVDYVLVDPVADLGLTASTRCFVERVEYSFSGFDGQLEFDSGLVDDNQIWVLNRDLHYHDFTCYGGLQDKSGPDGTGKIQISTTGLMDANSKGSLILSIHYG
jgi:hypothetical protein